MITVTGLHKAYQRQSNTELRVLDDVSFTLHDGEFLGIIGPSGCGKTTLLKILAGLVGYDTGVMEVNGVPSHGPGPDRRMVFQDFALLPWRTVVGNVEFGLENRGLARADRRARAMAALDTMDLTDFQRYYPYQLSGGMQQRVGLARALAVGAETLLMDEPFGALDAQTRRYLQEDLLRLVEGTGRSVLLVTHDMDESVLLCDRILVMAAHPGRVVEVVDTAGLIPRPRGDRVDMIKGMPEYAKLVNRIWADLADASGRRPGAAGGREQEEGS